MGQYPVDARDTGALHQFLTNRLSRARFAVLGQVLEGPTTQDRLVERSQMVGPSSLAAATAYCCEELFLARPGEPLTMTAHLLPQAIRSLLVRTQHELLARVTEGAPLWRTPEQIEPTQKEIWAQIRSAIESAGIPSPHRAWLDVVQARPGPRAQIGAFRPAEGAVGLAIASEGRIQTIECFGSPAWLDEETAGEIVSSHLPVAGISAGGAGTAPIAGELNRFRAILPSTRVYLTDGGGGVSLQFDQPGIAGMVLACGAGPVHLYINACGR